MYPEDETTHCLVYLSMEEEIFLEGTLAVVVSLASRNLQEVEFTSMVVSASNLVFASKLATGWADKLVKILS